MIIRITILELPSINNTITLTITVAGMPLVINEIFKSTRSTAGEVEIGDTVSETASNLLNALISDYSSYLAGTNLTSDSLDVYATNGSAMNAFTNNSDAIEFEVAETPLSLTGIESNRYLINNEVWITLSVPSNTGYYTVNLTNNYNQKVSGNIIVSPNTSGQARLNLQPYLKSMFEYPKDADGYIINDQIVGTANDFTITASAESFDSVSITKTFIRGGRRTNDTNQTLPSLATLRPTQRLPIWSGYETASYSLNESNQVIKTLLASLTESLKDYRRKKGCNEVYVKFANQYGGYSNWLFESHTDTETGSNLGSFIRNNELADLGNDFDAKTKLYSKVPEYYRDLIRDLIVSHEVYLLIDSQYVRVVLGKNTMTFNNVDRSYTVNLNFDFDYRFNPSLLWSN